MLPHVVHKKLEEKTLFIQKCAEFGWRIPRDIIRVFKCSNKLEKLGFSGVDHVT